jgi:integrase
MARGIHKLGTAREVAKLKEPGYYGDGGGLWLQVAPGGSRSWVYRFTIQGKAREMGLGGFPLVSLEAAREETMRLRKVTNRGKGEDPIQTRQKDRDHKQAAKARAKTFKEAASAYIEAQRPGWKNAKHGYQWESTLATWAYPLIGFLDVAAVDTHHVLDVLRQPVEAAGGQQLWNCRTETASRVRGRIEAILDWATFKKYRPEGANPARWKGHLENDLPSRKKVQTVEHFPALPYREMTGFMADLGKREGIAARAVEFAILTAARSGEVRGATWAEINLEERVWTIPAGRMKAGKEHRVPLSDAAVAVLKGLPRVDNDETVFRAPRGGVLSDMTLTAVLRRMGRADLTVHGFRSAFRDWAGETTAYPREVVEHALAHQLKDKAEAAYQRGDLLTKRARLMMEWARFCTMPVSDAVEKVIGINQAA